MKPGTLEPLMDLLRIASPSGHEREASAAWLARGCAFSDEAETDRLGNAYLRLKQSGGPRVIVAAHIDELALMVTHIDECGFLSFDTMGRWDADVLAGQRVKILTRHGVMHGVVGRADLFRRTEEMRARAARKEDYWIDIGASSEAEALQAVRIGDPIVIDAEPFLLTENLIVARGLDDRAGCFVIAEVLRELHRLRPPVSATAIATTQEEIGFRGAHVAARKAAADVAVAVDLYSTSDTPGPSDATKQLGEIRLGAGPIVGRGPNIDPDLCEHLVRTAERHGIPYQMEGEPRATSTDASILQLGGEGALTALISIPNRYSHSPVEIVDRRDMENAIRLIGLSIAGLPDAEWLDVDGAR